MKQFTCGSFLEFQFVSDPQLSPDGMHTAFIGKKPDIRKNGYDSALYLLNNESGTVRRLTSLGPVSAYTWEDQDTILFPGMRSRAVQEAAKAGEDCMGYYAISLTGGEAKERFTLPIKGGKLYPLGDGLYAVTAVWDNERPDLSGCSETEGRRMLSEYKNRGYERIREVPFTQNGAGFVNGKRTRLYLYDSKTGELKALTEPRFQVGGIKTDAGRILYIGQEFTDVKSLKNGVYLYEVKTGKSRCLMKQDQYLVKGFELYGDSAILVLTDGNSYGNGENGDFYRLDLTSGSLELFLAHDHHCVGNTVTTDVKLGAGQTMKIDRDQLYFTSTVNMDARVEAIDLKTRESRYLTENGAVDFLDVKNGRIMLAGFFGDSPEELYCLEDGSLRRMTHFNQEIEAQYAVSTPEFLRAKSTGDWEIEGYVLKPDGFDEKKSYPAVLSIHGGPRLTYGNVLNHQMQMFAAAGYFVFFCNPRGAEGRGNAFGDIRKRFGTIDFEDIMAFTDAVLAKYPQIDERRVCVEGGSYGGFMTNWIIGHTDRFCAACSQRSIANWTGMEGTTDIGYYFCKGQTGASHMEDHELQWRQSPLASADRCKTPTLFIHGEKDYRCWMQEAFQMYAALKLHGCPAKLCLFEGENHELSRSGRPKQRLQRLVEMKDWFDRWTKTGELDPDGGQPENQEGEDGGQKNGKAAGNGSSRRGGQPAVQTAAEEKGGKR